MGYRNNPKREKQIEKARQQAIAENAPFLDPGILYGRASADDIEYYSAEMLAASAAHSFEALSRWTGDAPHISIAQVEGVTPRDIPVTVLTIIGRNMPFLYDSVMGEVTSSYRGLYLAVHPILVPDATAQAGYRLAEPDDDPAGNISLIQLHIAPLTQQAATALEERLRFVLAQVQSAYRDWRPMLSKLDEALDELSKRGSSRRKTERAEAVEFLNWLRNDNFTFLGMRDYTYSGTGKNAKIERGDGVGLGSLSDPDVRVLRLGKDAVTTTPEILAFLDGPDFLIVTKANVKSIVHRRAYMDYIGIKRFDEDGNVIGELRIVGLFTATAYTRSVKHIPLLRAKIADVERHFGFDPNSHSGRILQNTLEAYPRDDLFQIETDLLIRFIEQIMELSDRPRVRVLARIDRFDRFVSAIIFVPREEYNSYVREKIGDYLSKVYDGHISAYYPAFPEGAVARVHFIVGRTEGKTPRIAQDKLEDAVSDIAARWIDHFVALSEPGAPVLEVDQAYQEAFTPEEAIGDMADILATVKGEPVRIEFYQQEGQSAETLSLKIFHRDGHLPLSRRVPLLENLGFNVISERTFDIGVISDGEKRDIVLHDMELAVAKGVTLDLPQYGQKLEEAFLAAFSGKVDNDNFNRLILACGLTVREVSVLRAYARYLRQTGIVYSQEHISETLFKYPAISRNIFALFKAGFDPSIDEKKRLKKLAEMHKTIEAALSGVPNLDEDRTLRRYVNAIDATLRTNYFQKNTDGTPRDLLAFKFDPKHLDGLPDPRPFREIFVYGTEVEGVHLRFGKVARGGLRWSDRGQDYRTEVLGLVKAQQVKNAVIVPVGAKGGFFPKNLPVGGSRDEVFNAGREAYKTYIRTLLSITDNIVDDAVVPPADTLRLDGDDPYFVVAADKGTATFSDTANGLAHDAGFWLDDAFASGGSAGYDHKKMGITARGAWETVKRHFREMDTDIQTTPFTVAGVGDMSGDVFGNGMLLSEKIRLIAAFDHRDIFIDPDPDTDKSFAERKRLFELPRSSWQDYDRSTLSKGAMIISRSEKSVTLTPEAVAAIGIDKSVATPFEIMTAILKAPTDLLWFGGIGTYIKAAVETNAEVGDRANDPIRVNATELRAKVIGEGANLGITQKGRIAYALAGGRCNSDAIDNSAGVNSSDVEVNIKIALASAVNSGRLTMPKRNQLLASMTPEVAQLVLRNNYLQSLAISLTERLGLANREELGRLMSALEATGQLNRKVETLPSNAELSERYATGKPLTRPEIGVLLSYAKLTLFDALVASPLPDEPYLQHLLVDYFPAKMQKNYADDIKAHRLHREIVATALANAVVNRGGPGFVQKLADASGLLSADVVKAAVIVEDGFGLKRLWSEVDALDGKIGGEVQNGLYATITRIYSDASRLYLQTGSVGAGTSDMATEIERLKTAIKTLSPAAAKYRRELGVTEIDGVPSGLLEELDTLSLLVYVPEIMRIAENAGTTLARAAESYATVSSTFRVARLLDASQRITPADHYESLALLRSQDQIALSRRRIVISALTEYAKEKDPVQAWYAADRVRVNRIVSELGALSESGDTNLARLTVAAGLLGDIVQTR
ncbi:NAD-glutamate dehydrogenase [Agrobacterium tumefaciens]|uniref:NAD-glutamate dehydrogenase n=1 Tax=Agrobacterium tumefaciens TaxID=358 RepID=A0AA44FAV3_AGRTU|nr:NAD-glutamate dehydrogenase [Agrobacterium tumefaciens]NSL20346.1 NAD-glutamate dehydrogenase [Agrobacterium tumefaciens]NTB89419.1 NAD-glutamate dehydrogenase [Agrobacterium tumefaciens]NTC19297.1 NAD-glutamate dehydrogenase [Agrobacterium tumefaciens]NTC31773.1 NAD-glutamate dehydrogenase [Agrobacterium tumefaciens]NTC58469.1 NAD-glutamate dehydrogenase [Agrobacterium tumefaciens]